MAEQISIAPERKHYKSEATYRANRDAYMGASQPIPGSLRIVKETRGGCLLGFRVEIARHRYGESHWFRVGRISPTIEGARLVRDWHMMREQIRTMPTESETVE